MSRKRGTCQGPGSPGNENWYFGSLTEIALKKFQEKNGLEVTGKIDFKTWKVINNYVTGAGPIALDPPPPLQGGARGGPNEKVVLADEKRKSINEQNKKDFEEARKAKIEKDAETKNLAKESKKSYIQSLIDKTTGYFTGQSNPATTSLTQTSTTQEQNPYLQNNNQNPYLTQQPQQSQQEPTQQQQNPYLPQNSQQEQQRPSFTNGIMQGLQGPPPQGSRLAGGDGNGNGFGMVLTTVYGHERNGSSDSADNGQPSCRASCSTRKGGACEKVASLKASVRKSIFGNGNSYCGKELEIVYPSRKTCGVYVLFETGPAEYLQQSLDLTGTTWNELDPGGKSGKAWMQFRVLKTGDKACEGYTRVDGKTN